MCWLYDMGCGWSMQAHSRHPTNAQLPTHPHGTASTRALYVNASASAAAGKGAVPSGAAPAGGGPWARCLSMSSSSSWRMLLFQITWGGQGLVGGEEEMGGQALMRGLGGEDAHVGRGW